MCSSDLHRSRFHRWAAAIATRGAPDILRHDAIVSVEAGFTKREARDAAARIGIAGWTRYRRPPLWYRFTLAGERPGAWELS